MSHLFSTKFTTELLFVIFLLDCAGIMLGGFVEQKALPSRTAPRLCFTPVNEAASMMLALAQPWKDDFKVFHVPVTRCAHADHFLAMVAQQFPQRRMMKMSVLQWKNELASLPVSNPLFPFKLQFGSGVLLDLDPHEAKQTISNLHPAGPSACLTVQTLLRPLPGRLEPLREQEVKLWVHFLFSSPAGPSVDSAREKGGEKQVISLIPQKLSLLSRSLSLS